MKVTDWLLGIAKVYKEIQEQDKKLEPMFSAYVETKVKVNRVDNLVNKIIGGMKAEMLIDTQLRF